MDDLGRSVLSRVIHGYRVSLGVALASVAMAVLLGLPLGLLAGYAEGVLDQLIMRPLDILMAFPAILLAIALTSVFGTGVLLVSLALAIVYVPIVARVVRAAVLATKAEVYVEGARAVGATARRLVLRHIVPNCVTPLLVQASVLMAIAILVEAALSFLGVGVRPPTPSLGTDALGRARIHAAGAVGGRVPGAGDPDRRARLQHARRRLARLARPAAGRGPLTTPRSVATPGSPGPRPPASA